MSKVITEDAMYLVLGEKVVPNASGAIELAEGFSYLPSSVPLFTRLQVATYVNKSKCIRCGAAILGQYYVGMYSCVCGECGMGGFMLNGKAYTRQVIQYKDTFPVPASEHISFFISGKVLALRINTFWTHPLTQAIIQTDPAFRSDRCVEQDGWVFFRRGFKPTITLYRCMMNNIFDATRREWHEMYTGLAELCNAFSYWTNGMRVNCTVVKLPANPFLRSIEQWTETAFTTLTPHFSNPAQQILAAKRLKEILT